MHIDVCSAFSNLVLKQKLLAVSYKKKHGIECLGSIKLWFSP